MAQALSGFRALRHLEISPHCDGMGFRSLYRALLDEKNRFRVATRFFVCCPPLQRLGLPGVGGGLSWYARSGRDALVGDAVVLRN